MLKSFTTSIVALLSKSPDAVMLKLAALIVALLIKSLNSPVNVMLKSFTISIVAFALLVKPPAAAVTLKLSA